MRNIKRDALLLGEGWDLQTPLPLEEKATLNNAKKMPHIAQFNDQFRDGIKGSTFHINKRGFAFGGYVDCHHLQYIASGSLLSMKETGLFLEPAQSINYVECHDNMTMWDKLMRSNEESEEILKTSPSSNCNGDSVARHPFLTCWARVLSYEARK